MKGVIAFYRPENHRQGGFCDVLKKDFEGQRRVGWDEKGEDEVRVDKSYTWDQTGGCRSNGLGVGMVRIHAWSRWRGDEGDLWLGLYEDEPGGRELVAQNVEPWQTETTRHIHGTSTAITVSCTSPRVRAWPCIPPPPPPRSTLSSTMVNNTRLLEHSRTDHW